MMAEPISPNSREIDALAWLRGARVQASLGMVPDARREAIQRGRLVPLLAYAVGNDNMGANAAEGSSEGASPEAVEIAASVALARVSEDSLMQLSTLALAAQLLSQDRQFARMQALGERFEHLGRDLKVERPFLSLALEALVALIEGKESRVAPARERLARALGVGTDAPVERLARRTPSSVCDILIANGLRRWMRDDDLSRLEQARVAALNWGLSANYELAELILCYARAARASDPVRLVPQSEPLFDSPRLLGYLKRSGIHTLFRAQQRAIEGGVLEPEDCLVTLPTSSGKTFLAEVRIVAELERNPEGRVIYLAPYRLLARQVEASLRRGLRLVGKTVRDYGGDYDINLAEQLVQEQVPDVAVMTPERLDALLRLADSQRRGSADAQKYLESVSLLVFDEIHVVGRGGRGARLELLLLRLRNRFPNTPLMALSAVTGEPEQFASWLGIQRVISGGRRPTGTLELLWKEGGDLQQRFGSSPRKVTSLKRVKTAFQAAADLVLKFEPGYFPVLILETRRDYAEKAIQEVLVRDPRASASFRDSLSRDDLKRLDSAVEDTRAALGSNHPLAALLRGGLAYHHARLPPGLLRTIEGLAERSLLRAIATTTTVAEGAHLPFKVVVIPHLNFLGSGGARRLEKSLYDNIIGRAGRAGVAAEGIVIVLDSSSRTLKGYVERELWRDQVLPLSGQLGFYTSAPETLEQVETDRQVRSQVLAWIGDRGSYVEDQAGVLARSTLSYHTGSPAQQAVLGIHFGRIFSYLENYGLAQAASPYQLTELGRRARLAGISPTSCVRIIRELDQAAPFSFEALLSGVTSLDPERCAHIARFIFYTEEALDQSLWLADHRNDEARVAILKELAEGKEPWPEGEELFEVDVQMLAWWIEGRSFEDIAEGLPVLDEGVLADPDGTARLTLVLERLTRLSQPAAWAWSGVTALTPSQGQNIPIWIRRAVEQGVPSETAAELIHRVHLSRFGALALHKHLSPDAASGLAELFDLDFRDPHIGLPTSDSDKVQAWINESLAPRRPRAE